MNDLPILYEDDDVLAVNKPAGLVVHADGRTSEPNVTDWVLKHYPNIKGVGEPLTLHASLAGQASPTPHVIDRPGIVHRIDRDTSGVLLIAKHQPAFLHLKEQFKNREVSKAYHAFVYGEMKEEDGVIDRPIGRSRKDFRLWSAQRLAKGELRDAVTEYKVLMKGGGATFIEAYPKTGRTHQIRVHLKAVNHPVVCDKLYAPKRDPILGFKRLALHAKAVMFLSMAGKEIVVEADHPADFARAVIEMEQFQEGS